MKKEKENLLLPVRKALGLFNSMVYSGETHTPSSQRMLTEALQALDKAEEQLGSPSDLDIEPYYYKHKASTCLEACQVTPYKIGSLACQTCAHYEGGSTKDFYILCSKIKEATK